MNSIYDSTENTTFSFSDENLIIQLINETHRKMR